MTWRAIPYAELDATSDRWLFVTADGSPMDASPEADAKRRAWEERREEIRRRSRPTEFTLPGLEAPE